MPGVGVVSVEAATSTGQLRRFRDIPYVLHHDDARWRPPVRSFESWRLDTNRHDYFDRGDAMFFLARRGAEPVGRIAVHHPGGDERADGRFAALAVADDESVVRALVGAACDWLAGNGIDSLRGPVSWASGVAEGVRVTGCDLPAITAHPWNPPWYEAHLRSVGAERATSGPSWIAPITHVAADPAPATDLAPPPHAGPYRDPALVLDGVAAAPDVSELVADTSLRGAWRRAQLARQRRFERAVCVRCDGDAARLVPRLAAAAAAAGYRELVSPIGAGEPDLIDATFRLR